MRSHVATDWFTANGSVAQWPDPLRRLRHGRRLRSTSINAELRQEAEFRGQIAEPMEPDPKEKRFRRRLRQLEARARNRVLPSLLKTPIPADAWLSVSPFPVDKVPVEEHWRLLLQGLFEPLEPKDRDDYHVPYVWISGSAIGRAVIRVTPSTSGG
jgi:hypothetical protein